jgi:hypothetical protein
MKTKKTPMKKKTLVERRPIGIRILGSFKAPLTCHMMYQDTYCVTDAEGRIEAVTETVQGASVRTLTDFMDLNGSKKQRERNLLTFRPDLRDHMEAARVLLTTLEDACMQLDTQLSKKPVKR